MGILIPTESCPVKMLDDIMKYFEERNEDEFLHERSGVAVSSDTHHSIDKPVETEIE